VALLYGARGTFPRAVIDGARAHAIGLGLDVVGQAQVVGNLSHWAGMFRWPSGGVKRYCR